MDELNEVQGKYFSITDPKDVDTVIYQVNRTGGRKLSNIVLLAVKNDWCISIIILIVRLCTLYHNMAESLTELVQYQIFSEHDLLRLDFSGEFDIVSVAT